jgi:hypothetical protein
MYSINSALALACKYEAYSYTIGIGKEMSEQMWIKIDLEMDRDCDIQLTCPRCVERIVDLCV